MPNSAKALGSLAVPRILVPLSLSIIIGGALTGTAEPIESSPIHHEHPYTGETDHAYSLFMHHTSGAALVILGALVLIDRLTCYRYTAIEFGIGITWALLGAFLFIKADPDGWPIGEAGFLESFQMPTAGEWLQHKILSLVPLLIGANSLAGLKASHGGLSSPNWKIPAALLATLGATGLLVHQHSDHPGMDIVNAQHSLFAVTGFIIAAGLFTEPSPPIRRRVISYVFPFGLMLLGLQLLVFTQ